MDLNFLNFLAPVLLYYIQLYQAHKLNCFKMAHVCKTVAVFWILTRMLKPKADTCIPPSIGIPVNHCYSSAPSACHLSGQGHLLTNKDKVKTAL